MKYYGGKNQRSGSAADNLFLYIYSSV